MVDGKWGHKKIAKMWASHFKSLFNTVKDEQCKQSVTELINKADGYNGNHLLFDSNIVIENINKLEKGKTYSSAGLFAKHLIYVTDKLSILLTTCFNAWLPEIIEKKKSHSRFCNHQFCSI